MCPHSAASLSAGLESEELMHIFVFANPNGTNVHLCFFLVQTVYDLNRNQSHGDLL